MATKTRRLADLLANIDDNSKVTSAGLLDATITAADLANDSVGAAEIIDDAVTNAAIADGAIDTAAKLGSNVVTSSAILDANITAAKLSSTALASVEHVKPHIQPETLYPASEGFLEDNTQYTFTDYSANGLAVTAHGSRGGAGLRHVTSQKKNHSTSIKLNGVDDYLTVADDADFDWGTSDFTVELWFMPWGAVGTAEVLFATNNTGGTDSEFYVRSENGRMNFARGADNLSGGTSDFNTLDTWYHLAFVNASGTITCYKNGTALYNFSAGGHDYNPTEGFSIGARKTGGSYSQFGQYYVDDVRVVKGLAVYTGNFTAPTGPLTATWSANPFGGSNTAANADANKIACLVQSNPTGLHSGAYGTAQSTGRKYYYTDILGSKPIKDPRIGAHFGSHRHTFRSQQILEQETAHHGNDVYSLDGREWCKMVGRTWVEQIGNDGTRYYTDTVGNFVEIVGYFSGANYLTHSTTINDFGIAIDGTTDTATYTGGTAAHDTPLADRFMNNSICVNLAFSSTPTLGIHTLKLSCISGDYLRIEGIELVAQDLQDFTATNATNILTSAGHTLSNGDQIRLAGADLPNGLNATTTYYVIGASGNNFQVATTSTGSAVTFSDDGSGSRTFRSLNTIQIPAQNVVSYGKKFSVSAAAQHYNPFAVAANGTTAVGIGNTTSHGKVATGWSGTTAGHFDSTLDTATSLGLSAWETGGNFYRPVNGGRVVKWVDSSGNIKTSVTMIPPCATAIIEGSDASLPTSHAWTTVYQPKIKSGAINHAQAEIAKTFHWREFGNGSQNGGTGAGGNKADASMLASTSDHCTYVMDDGLTCLNGWQVKTTGSGINQDFHVNASSNGYWHFTFIGTGISFVAKENATAGTTDGMRTIAQNLPYGTHIIKVHRDADSTPDITLDGISMNGVTSAMPYASFHEVSIHQPKMPPIPEDAVVLADYMLMADYVKSTGGAGNHVSKGVRLVSASRDCFYTSSIAYLESFAPEHWIPYGLSIYTNTNASAGVGRCRLSSFGTQMEIGCYATRGDVFIDGVDTNHTTSGTGYAGLITQDTASILGIHDFESRSTGNNHNTTRLGIATPIHTSSHYQSFETPYLKDLVGGDRNMEQTNLVVTADGKSWDEVTRDTSYIGTTKVRTDHNNVHANAVNIFDEWRGQSVFAKPRMNKDFAIAYDRMICLKDGNYLIMFLNWASNNDDLATIYINGAAMVMNKPSVSGNASGTSFLTAALRRGDYVQGFGCSGNGSSQYNIHMNFEIMEIAKG